MTRDGRAAYDRAVHRARVAAYPPGEYVEQESFMRASEIRELAERAGVGPRVAVLDLCCGVAGPGRYLTRELGCSYLGLDLSPDAVDLARARAAGLPCRFQVAQVPPVPAGPFDVVLLLETLLAFPDKEGLFRDVARALPPGGRFAFTVEEGTPLTARERALMPRSDTVWLSPLSEVCEALGRARFGVRWERDITASHAATAQDLRRAFEADADVIARGIGQDGVDDLLAAHRLWADWLRTGRVRKVAVVAEKERLSDPGLRRRRRAERGRSSDRPRGPAR